MIGLSFLMQLVSQYDQHYPDFIDEHIFINGNFFSYDKIYSFCAKTKS